VHSEAAVANHQNRAGSGRAGVGDHGDRLGLDYPRVHVERDTRRDRLRRVSERVDDPSPQQQPGLHLAAGEQHFRTHAEVVAEHADVLLRRGVHPP
jgi:hypothetical protein